MVYCKRKQKWSHVPQGLDSLEAISWLVEKSNQSHIDKRRDLLFFLQQQRTSEEFKGEEQREVH